MARFHSVVVITLCLAMGRYTLWYREGKMVWEHLQREVSVMNDSQQLKLPESVPARVIPKWLIEKKSVFVSDIHQLNLNIRNCKRNFVCLLLWQHRLRKLGIMRNTHCQSMFQLRDCDDTVGALVKWLLSFVFCKWKWLNWLDWAKLR